MHNRKSADSSSSSTTSASSPSPRWTCSNGVNLWIRVALLEKVLVSIVEFLVENCSKFYEPDSFISNPVCGPILASLLGLCSVVLSLLFNCNLVSLRSIINNIVNTISEFVHFKSSMHSHSGLFAGFMLIS